MPPGRPGAHSAPPALNIRTNERKGHYCLSTNAFPKLSIAAQDNAYTCPPAVGRILKCDQSFEASNLSNSEIVNGSSEEGST
jgi:hypothetical protein